VGSPATPDASRHGFCAGDLSRTSLEFDSPTSSPFESGLGTVSSPSTALNGTTSITERVRNALVATNDRLSKILESLSPRTALFVISGQGDCRAASALLKKRSEWTRLTIVYGSADAALRACGEQVVFDEADFDSLAEAIEIGRLGVGLFGIVGHQEDHDDDGD
jgi:hypothetical protein